MTHTLTPQAAAVTLWSIEKTSLFGLTAYKIWFGTEDKPKTRRVGDAWTLFGARRVAKRLARQQQRQKDAEANKDENIIEQFAVADKRHKRIGFVS